MAQTPGIDTPTDTIKVAAWYHEAALSEEAATRGLQPAFAAAVRTWEGALTEVDAAIKRMSGPRVALRFAEARLETVLDALWQDAGKKGNEALKAALFPDGKVAETKPRGQAQADRTERALLPRLRALPADGPLQTHLEPVTAALAAFVAALAGRKSGAVALSQATANERIAREDLVAAFRASLGGITEIYPRSTSLRDRFFFEFRSSGSDVEESPPAAT